MLSDMCLILFQYDLYCFFHITIKLIREFCSDKITFILIRCIFSCKASQMQGSILILQI